MRITVTCPRCKQSMSAASKLAGSYVSCAHCNGRFWVPEAAVDEPPQPVPPPSLKDSTPVPPEQPLPVPVPGTPPASAGATGSPARSSSSGPPAGPIPKAPPPPGSTTEPRPASAVPEKPAGGPPSLPAQANRPAPAAPTTRPGKKVARFITAEAAQSTLRLAEDGKLPELHLQEISQAKSKQEKGLTIHPLVLLVLYEPQQQTASRSARMQQARRLIERDFFGGQEHFALDNPPPLEPYQVYLREAQRAYARGDRQAERRMYRRVLELLRVERSGFESVTGSPSRDRQLEEQIVILLSDE